MRRFYCEACAHEHPARERQALIRRLGEVTYSEVRAAFGSHPWPESGAGERMLLRDLRAVRGYAKDSREGAVLRLGRFLKLVLEEGMCSGAAGEVSRCDALRGRDALRELGYRYINRGRWGNSGWFRRGRSGGFTKSRAATRIQAHGGI